MTDFADRNSEKYYGLLMKPLIRNYNHNHEITDENEENISCKYMLITILHSKCDFVYLVLDIKDL